MNTMRFLMPVVVLILCAPRGVQGQSVIAVSNTANRTIHLVDQSTGLTFKTVGVHSEVSGLASDDGDQVFYYTIKLGFTVFRITVVCRLRSANLRVIQQQYLASLFTSRQTLCTDATTLAFTKSIFKTLKQL